MQLLPQFRCKPPQFTIPGEGLAFLQYIIAPLSGSVNLGVETGGTWGSRSESSANEGLEAGRGGGRGGRAAPTLGPHRWGLGHSSSPQMLPPGALSQGGLVFKRLTP